MTMIRKEVELGANARVVIPLEVRQALHCQTGDKIIFLVTDAGATASDVIELMDQVIKRVHDAFGVTLAREVVVWKRTVR